MKKVYLFFSAVFFVSIITAQQKANIPIVDNEVVFNETDGIVAVEAEFFYKQTNNDKRSWYITHKNLKTNVGRDDDGPHIYNSSNNAYLEILPDTRVTHADNLVAGENFSNEPGKLSVLHYKVNFNNLGRYYVWVRAYSSGSEDNGLHVGLNGYWPESGARMQWCEGKKTWHWESKQRTEKVHCGEPWLIYLDIDKPGVNDITFSMREDGFEFDKFILANDTLFRPEGFGTEVNLYKGVLPSPFQTVLKEAEESQIFSDIVKQAVSGTKLLKATGFEIEGSNFYRDQNKWLAINPNKFKEAKVEQKFPFPDGMYDMVFIGVGENDGKSEYKVWVNDKEVGQFIAPQSISAFAEGAEYCELWENIQLKKGDKISVYAKVGSIDGVEYSRGRWSGIAFAPMTKGKEVLENVVSMQQNVGEQAKIINVKKKNQEPLSEPRLTFSDKTIRQPDGDGSVTISGELKQWHKVTLTLDGPFAHELDADPNPFTDYNMQVTFTHESGEPTYTIPAYFAADGNAANTSSDCGIKWRAHVSPDKIGKWTYEISFLKGSMISVIDVPWANELKPYNGIKGSFVVGMTDKTGKDFRAKGRLEYVGAHYLQFKGNNEYFLKAGADAPETFLAYEDFDATYSLKANVPVKSWENHLQDYNLNDPTWKNGKGKAIIGAVNYLSNKGANVFSFLTYNAGGDGDNVWPFVSRNEKFHYDCSKLDQWAIVFDHAQSKGMYLHFKTQETENDDNKKGKMKRVIPSLDGGDLGPERRLYYRELVARYSYLLALNWNMGEENTQSLKQRKDMISFMSELCPYQQNIILHTYPNQQDTVYTPLLGKESLLTGVSLQNQWNEVHKRTLQWVSESDKAGRAWVVANDEQGSAGTGVPPDNGYKGFDGDALGYNMHDVRKQTLWGNIMAGGAGVEYYFGYKLAENDLVCQDYRSRDKQWEYAKIALDFFSINKVPFWEMTNKNKLIGNKENEKDKYCFAKEGELYLVYLGYAKTSTLDLSNVSGEYSVLWFNPREGGKMKKGNVKKVLGGSVVDLGEAPINNDVDWLVVIKKK